MPEKMPQTFANYARLDPPYHFFVVPVLGITLLVAIWYLIQNPGFYTAWRVVVAAALIVLAFKARTYALKAQDRLIRLEERLRLAHILPASEHHRINDISCAQLIALRFAPDQELAAIALKTLDQNLAPKTIKESIINWRVDDHRI